MRATTALAATVTVGGLLAAASAANAASPATAAAYTFTTIDVPGANSTVASGINDAGQIVGSFTDATGGHGFLDTGGSFTTIDAPGTSVTGTSANGINNAGQIVGSFVETFTMGRSATHGFLDTGGSFTTIDVPDASFRGAPPFTVAFGINNAGQIVGYFVNNPPGQRPDFIPRGFLDTGGSFTTINLLGTGANTTQAFSINDTGQIVGSFNTGMRGAPPTHGFLDTGGSLSIIDAPGTSVTGTSANGINNAGQIVGSVVETFTMGRSATHGFLDTGGSFTTIDVSGASGKTTALGINDRGQIVGFFNDTTGAQHGFLANPFAGVPGQANCHGKSVSALARQFGGLDAAAAALGFASAQTLQNAILAFCGR